MDIDLNTLSKLIEKPFLCEIDGERILVDPDTCEEDLIPDCGYRISDVRVEDTMVLLSVSRIAGTSPSFSPNDAWVKEQFSNGDITFL